MEGGYMEAQTRSERWGNGIINLILGIWLITSPFIFSYTSGAVINSVVLGILVSALAVVHLSMPNQMWVSWLIGISGLWLVLAPFILGFTESAVLWNELSVGIVVTILGFLSSVITIPIQTPHHHAM